LRLSTGTTARSGNICEYVRRGGWGERRERFATVSNHEVDRLAAVRADRDDETVEPARE
jgi:hypothetical protein